MQSYNYSHIPLKDLLWKLAQLPEDTVLSGQLMEEEVRQEAATKKAHEAIRELRGSGNGKLFDTLMEYRSAERARER